MQESTLYKQKIIDHYKSPRNFHKLDKYDYHIQLSNSVCGDEITLYLKADDGKISGVGFTGTGCAISMAGMSMLSEKLVGMTLEEAKNLDKKYVLDLLGMQEKSPRLKCAILGLEAVKGAIKMEKDEPCDFC